MHNNRTINSSADHKLGIARRFSRAAPHYDRYAAFQRACGDRLFTLTGSIAGQKILDAGCGTGWFSRRWQANRNQVVALDLSDAMLGFARKQRSAEAYILGDIERLPLATGSMDIVYSNLAVQWCNNLPQALAELHRVLRPNGILALSTLAQGSLEELVQAWGQVDDSVHINRFLPQSAIMAAFAPYRHRLLVELYCLHYPQLTDLLREIKGVGAGYLHDGRTPGLTSRSRFQALEDSWPYSPSGLPLTYHVVYGMIHRD